LIQKDKKSPKFCRRKNLLCQLGQVILGLEFSSSYITVIVSLLVFAIINGFTVGSFFLSYVFRGFRTDATTTVCFPFTVFIRLGFANKTSPMLSVFLFLGESLAAISGGMLPTLIPDFRPFHSSDFPPLLSLLSCC